MWNGHSEGNGAARPSNSSLKMMVHRQTPLSNSGLGVATTRTHVCGLGVFPLVAGPDPETCNLPSSASCLSLCVLGYRWGLYCADKAYLASKSCTTGMKGVPCEYSIGDGQGAQKLYRMSQSVRIIFSYFVPCARIYRAILVLLFGLLGSAEVFWRSCLRSQYLSTRE